MATTKVIDFWAPWCGPCRIMNPILDELEKELGDKVEIEKINVDEDQAKSQQFGVMSIPTYVIVKDGKEVGRKIGVTPKADLLALINA
jgi:thioredoxin 1